MSNRGRDVAFVSQVDRLRSLGRRFQVLRGMCWVVFAAGCGLLLLAAADYRFELPWIARSIGLAVVVCATGALGVTGVLIPLRWWSRPRTAVEIEERFPQLGQRVRTVVQFFGRDEVLVKSDGVMPGLITALEEDTETRVRPLDLRKIVPAGRLKTAALLGGAPIVLLVCALFHWESRLAVGRALLGHRSYTILAVVPGDTTVDEGGHVALSVRLKGRPRRRVALYSRPLGSDELIWQERELTVSDTGLTDDHSRLYETTLKNIVHPTEYQFAAGPAESGAYRILVRHPLGIGEFQVKLIPPGYTGAKPQTVEGGDLDLIEGTRVLFQVVFDHACTEASLVLADPPYARKDGETEPGQIRVPLDLDGNRFVTEMPFHNDKEYRLDAVARDGRLLPENFYRIRVRKDQAPRVRFERPNEALEVHSIAEVLMHINADDDFGLTKAGIVFQIDNGKEQTLLVEDLLETITQAEQEGKPLTTRAVCQKALPLEEHKLTPTQSVIYYAFAVDNHPGQLKRTETELRFIDIRPFKRTYRLANPPPPGGGGGL